MKTKGSRPLHIIQEASSIVVLILLPEGGPDQGLGEPQDGLDGDLKGHQGHLRPSISIIIEIHENIF